MCSVWRKLLDKQHPSYRTHSATLPHSEPLPTTTTRHYTICCKNRSLTLLKMEKSCPKHVELILETNKFVIVAYSSSFYLIYLHWRCTVKHISKQGTCLLGCEAVRNGNLLATFQRGIQLSTSVLTMKEAGSLEISVTSYRIHVVTSQKSAMFIVSVAKP